MRYSALAEAEAAPKNVQPIQWPPVVTPNDEKTIGVADLQALIKSSKWAKFTPVFTDSKYVGLTRAEWNAVLEETNTRALKYTPTVEDCDDFAFLARGVVPAVARVNGIAVCLDFEGRHAYNLVVVIEADGSFGLEAIEPQQDAFVPFASVGADPYRAATGMLLF